MAAVIDRQQVTARSTGAALGADIEGIDLAGAPAPEAIAAVKAAWAEHLVLRFRGQRLGSSYRGFAALRARLSSGLSSTSTRTTSRSTMSTLMVPRAASSSSVSHWTGQRQLTMKREMT